MRVGYRYSKPYIEERIRVLRLQITSMAKYELNGKEKERLREKQRSLRHWENLIAKMEPLV